jgi:hypothetical protein
MLGCDSLGTRKHYSGIGLGPTYPKDGGVSRHEGSKGFSRSTVVRGLVFLALASSGCADLMNDHGSGYLDVFFIVPSPRLAVHRPQPRA